MKKWQKQLVMRLFLMRKEGRDATQHYQKKYWYDADYNHCDGTIRM